MLYVVTYTGPFGFIKPWTAVRDGETWSQQFLTPSIIEGMHQKLFGINAGPCKIIRHRLSYDKLDIQQEVVHTRGWKPKKPRERGILKRGVMINPVLQLAFGTEQDARIAASQHMCLCRNEDLVYPEAGVMEVTEQEFNQLPGFELRFEPSELSFPVGYNRFDEGSLMTGQLEVVGKAVKYAGL